MVMECCNWCGEYDNDKDMVEVVDASGDLRYFHKHCHKEYHEWFDKKEKRFDPPV